MKRSTLCFIFLLIACLCFPVLSGAETAGNENPGTNGADRIISFEEESYVVYVGKQVKLAVKIENLLDSAPKQTQLIWSSSDQDIAAVNAGGMVNGKKAGKVIISAAAKDNENLSASVEVEVRVPVQSVQINEKNVSVLLGSKEEAAKAQLTVTVKPEDAYYQSGIWSSSNENIATVDSNGVVTGVGFGNAQITFTSDDPNGQKKTQIAVKVNQAVTGISAAENEVVHVKKTLMLKPEVLPKEATNKKLEFTSSDPSIATVSSTGQVTGIANGEATITCTATDGSDISASVHVSVFQPVKSLKMEKTQLNAFAGKTSEPLVVKVIPEDAKYQDYSWSSSDETIATVNDQGEVTGIAGGKVQITATSNEPVSGNNKPKSATCQVTVSQAVEYIGLEKNVDKSTDKKLVLTLTVLPETATNKNVVWETSNKKVATVNNGVVTIKKREGSATITATAKDGSGIYASCEVTVGFSGSILQIGSYVRKFGSYVWDVNNFSGNGEMPDASETTESETNDAADPDATSSGMPIEENITGSETGFATLQDIQFLDYSWGPGIG